MDPFTILALFKKWLLPVALFGAAVFLVNGAISKYFDARAKEQETLQNLIRDTTAQQIKIADQERNTKLLQESIDTEKLNREALEKQLDVTRVDNKKLRRDIAQRNLKKEIEQDAAVARDRINTEVNSLYKQFQSLSGTAQEPSP